jgi:outer membrane protein assembly factor BamA
MTLRFFCLLVSFCAFFLSEASTALYPVKHIHISGNKKTKTSIIERELVFHLEDAYSQSDLDQAIEQSRRQLINLNLFNRVVITDSLLPEGAWSMRIQVVEKWYIWPIPFVEYADRNFTQWQDFRLDPERTNYGMYFFWYNLRGRNETFKLTLSDGYTRNLGVEYRIPWVDKNKKHGLAVSAFHRRNREVWLNTIEDQLFFLRHPTKDLFVRNEYLLRWQYRKALFTTHRVHAFHHRFLIDSLVLLEGNNPAFLGGASSLFQSGLIYDYTFEQRDNRFYPLEGQFLGLNAGLSSLSTPDEMIKQWLAEGGVKAGMYRKWSQHLYSAFYAEASSRGVNQGQIPYWLNRSLGYRQSIRGFERYVIDGEHVLLAKMAIKTPILETRYLNLPVLKRMKGLRDIPFAAYTGVFGDWGYVFQEPPVNFSNQLPNTAVSSAGLGLDFVLYWDKLMRLEVSRNSLGDVHFFINFTQAM